MFLDDLGDQGARPGTKPLQIQELWGLPIVAVGTLGSLLKESQSIVVSSFGMPAALLTVFLLALALYWSILTIMAKQQSDAIVSPTGHPFYIYVYTWGVRLIAKLVLIVVIIILPYGAAEALHQLQPLPMILYGYLIDSKTSRPLSEIMVMVENKRGADITARSLPSDSSGFYIIHTSRNVSRLDRLKVYLPTCKKSILLSLHSAHETRYAPDGKQLPKKINPVFRHVISCD
jgi:hypothetical protein